MIEIKLTGIRDYQLKSPLRHVESIMDDLLLIGVVLKLVISWILSP